MVDEVNGWVIEHSSGPAGPFHERPLPAPLSPTVWIHRVVQPSLVLGSAQHDETIERGAAERAGYDVCRRRSGGGLVVVDPETSCWIDVLVPNGHELWDDDVGRAFHWVGATWIRTLAQLGHPGGLAHHGPLQGREWGRVVCFAGVGPGEVTLGGRKVVGLSQRRTRHGARFQGLIVTAWDPTPIRRFMKPAALPAELDAALDDLPVGRTVDLDAVPAAFIAALPPA